MQIAPGLLAIGTLTVGFALGALLGPRFSSGDVAAPKVEPTRQVEPVAPTVRSSIQNTDEPSTAKSKSEKACADVATPKVTIPPTTQVVTPTVSPSPSPSPPLLKKPSRVVPMDEQSWRKRAATIRDRLVTTYETCLAHAQTPYKYIIRDGHTTTIIDTSSFAEAKAAFLSAQSSLQFLHEEARRAGVPPGWVRLNWSGYSRNPSPDNGVCERILPKEIGQH